MFNNNIIRIGIGSFKTTIITINILCKTVINIPPILTTPYLLFIKLIDYLMKNITITNNLSNPLILKLNIKDIAICIISSNWFIIPC